MFLIAPPPIGLEDDPYPERKMEEAQITPSPISIFYGLITLFKGPQALPFRLKKNLRPFLTLSENIFPERNVPATLLFISPSVG